MNVFYEIVKYTMLMEKISYRQVGKACSVSVFNLLIYLTIRNVRDVTNSEAESVFEYNTNELSHNTFEFKVLEYIFKYQPC